VRELIDIINATDMRLLPVVVDLQGFQETVARAFLRPLDHPYF
jgi:hypothetical protein